MRKLVKCQACNKKISINATSCPNCGEPNIPKAKNAGGGIPKWVWVVGIVVILAGIIGQEDKSGNSVTPLSPAEQQKYLELKQKEAAAQKKLDAMGRESDSKKVAELTALEEKKQKERLEAEKRKIVEIEKLKVKKEPERLRRTQALVDSINKNPSFKLGNETNGTQMNYEAIGFGSCEINVTATMYDIEQGRMLKVLQRNKTVPLSEINLNRIDVGGPWGGWYNLVAYCSSEKGCAYEVSISYANVEGLHDAKIERMSTHIEIQFNSLDAAQEVVERFRENVEICMN